MQVHFIALIALLAFGCGGGGDVDPVDAEVCNLGSECTDDVDCLCGNTCAAKSCIAPSACNEALLEFTTATENTDGTCLTDLGGFNLYWGTTEDLAESTVIDMGLPCVDDMLVPCGGEGASVMRQVCAYRLTDLPNGTVYFAVTTYNTMGVESARTGAVSKMISCP